MIICMNLSRVMAGFRRHESIQRFVATKNVAFVYSAQFASEIKIFRTCHKPPGQHPFPTLQAYSYYLSNFGATITNQLSPPEVAHGDVHLSKKQVGTELNLGTINLRFQLSSAPRLEHDLSVPRALCPRRKLCVGKLFKLVTRSDMKGYATVDVIIFISENLLVLKLGGQKAIISFN